MNFSDESFPKYDTAADYSYEKDSDYVHLASDLYDDDGTRTICCNIPMEDYISSCFCQPSVLLEDLVLFEKYTEHIDIYAPNTVCGECVHYHTSLCPDYRNLLIDFTKSNLLDLFEATNSISPCPSYESLYITLEAER